MKKIILPIIILTFSAPRAGSQNFDGLVDQVLENNLSLKANAARNSSEIYSLKSDNTLSAPEVEFEYLWGTDDARDKFNAGITQNFDWPGAYSARSKSIKSRSEALRYLEQNEVIEKRVEIKSLYIDIINNKKCSRLIEQRLSIISQLIDKYARGVELGQFSRLDLNKLKIEKLKLIDIAGGISAESEKLKATLEKLNGGKPVDHIINSLEDYPDEPILPVDEYENQIEQSDPLQNYFQALRNAGKSLVKAEQAMRLPGLSIGYHHAREDGEIFNGMSLGITLPFLSSSNKVKSVKIMNEAIALDEESALNERKVNMLANREETLVLFRKYMDYREILADADSSSQLKKALDNGEISIIDYLSELNFFLEAEHEMLMAEHDYRIALTNLNKYLHLR